MKTIFLATAFVCAVLVTSCQNLTPPPVPQQESVLPAKQLRVPKIFGDHMVLQRNKPVRIWGWSAPFAKVTAAINGNEASVTATDKGTWLLELPAMNTGGPYTLRISDGKTDITYKDVLIGEVWICSGQSNMEWPLKGSTKCPVENSATEIKAAKYSDMRLIKIDRKPALYPQYDIAGGSWKACTPSAVAPFSAVAYFFGRKLLKELKVPVGLILSAWGGTPCQSWCSYSIVSQFPVYKNWIDHQRRQKDTKLNSWTPTSLFNGMIQPLVPYSIAGFIWYQGESNRKASREYTKLFPAMIANWRKYFEQGELPFYYCQIAPFRYREKDAGVKMREAQREVMKKLPNLGMVVLSDKTTLDIIHPPYKKEAGERLAGWALNKVYGKDVPYSGPLFRGFKVYGNTAVVSFDHSNGLHGSLDGFEVAGPDGVFHKASAEIKDDTVYLKSSMVKIPAAVRYAWGNTETGGLFNKAGLPASSFTTAEWKDR